MALACAVGEHPRNGVPAPESNGPPPAEPRRPTADPAPEAEPDADEQRAAEILVRGRLAFEATQVDDAFQLAHRILDRYPGTTSAEQARWLAARSAFTLGRHADAEALAEATALAAPRGSTLAHDAAALVALARDALEAPSSSSVVVGVILPRSGSRILVRYGDWILEGIQVAVRQMEQRHGRPVELVVADDGGGPRTRQAVAELERRGAIAIIGPMLPEQLPEASGARQNRGLLLVSPTIPETPAAWPAVYSIPGGDTRGAQSLGQYAAEVGLLQAALLYPRSSEYERKAQAFAVEFEALGGEVRASIPYDSGTTTFATHMRRILQAVAPVDTAVADTTPVIGLVPLPDTLAPGYEPDPLDPWLGKPPQEPFALFIPASDRDIRQIAPQVAFYGLDSAGVQVFGDEGWASPLVRRLVPPHDLEGVIASSHHPPGRADALADPAFVQAYEIMFRRSLENQLPAMGYDAAHLILQALPNRALTPDAVTRRFQLLTGIQGATGLLSVRSNQVVRSPFLVVVRNGRLAPAPHPWDFRLPVPKPPLPPPPPPDTAVPGGA